MKLKTKALQSVVVFAVAILSAFVIASVWSYNVEAAQEKPKEGILNKLFAPGPLMGGHKDLEEADCLKCHDAGNGVPQSKCLDCHKEIRKFVEEKKGYHGLTAKTCQQCHSDHKGREYDSISVDEKSFDHDRMTGFAIEGAHKKLQCDECHTQKRTGKYLFPQKTRYFGNVQSCNECHKKDDVHRFKKPYSQKQCSDCHNQEDWKKAESFDHFKETGYALKGHHARMKCSDCHGTQSFPQILKTPPFTYKWPKLKTQQCLACHTDHHKSGLSAQFQGGQCQTCHSEEKWKIEKFDHKTITGYALNGKHATITCKSCHKQTDTSIAPTFNRQVWKGLKTNCLSCHSDEHRFGNQKISQFKQPNQCIECHTEYAWKPSSFDHNVHTKYKLDGLHTQVSCKDCHLIQSAQKGLDLKPIAKGGPGQYHFSGLKEKTCNACHTNPHVKEFSKSFLNKACTDCHTTAGWRLPASQKNFNHDETRFKLTGSHIKVSCKECHGEGAQTRYKFDSVKSGFCVDCHKTPHKNEFSAKSNSLFCTDCHGTVNWKGLTPATGLKFDHGTTRFKIDGAHSPISCEDCHKKGESSFKFNSNGKQFCIDCHKSPHTQQFNSKTNDQSCVQCHSTTHFTKTPNFKHTQSHFELYGAHAKINCNECHTNAPQTVSKEFVKKENPPWHKFKFPGVSEENCVSCHKNDDVHKGSYGTQCKDCHTEESWKKAQDFHKNMSLRGTHQALTCVECHQNGLRLTGQSQNCVSCHQKDDVHFGTLTQCQECHQQSFWSQQRFRHSLTSFPLRGVHRTLNCNECHSQGVYNNLQNNCNSCHLRDVDNTNFNHNSVTNTECIQCHSEFTFQK